MTIDRHAPAMRDDPRPRRRTAAPSAPRPAGRGRGYTRFVNILKVVLPLLALALTAIVVIWPELQDRAADRATVADADPGRMMSPRLSGVDAHDRPYSIVGTSARQSDAGGDIVVFDNLEAELTMEDGTWLAVLSDHGMVDNVRSVIELSGDVNLFRDDGYTFYTDNVNIDLEERTAWGDDPVQAHGPAGEVAAQGFRIDNDSGVVVFTGRSELLLRRAPRDTLR